MNKTITKFLRENYLLLITVIAIVCMIIFIGNDPESKNKWATHVSDMTIGDLLAIVIIYTIFRNK